MVVIGFFFLNVIVIVKIKGKERKKEKAMYLGVVVRQWSYHHHCCRCCCLSQTAASGVVVAAGSTVVAVAVGAVIAAASGIIFAVVLVLVIASAFVFVVIVVPLIKTKNQNVRMQKNGWEDLPFMLHPCSQACPHRHGCRIAAGHSIGSTVVVLQLQLLLHCLRCNYIVNSLEKKKVLVKINM